jgi:DNA replication protein DnaC
LARYDPKKEGKGLVLEGEPGRGKTHLLCGILRELVFKHAVAVRFVEFTHLLSTMKESFDKRGGDPVRLTSLARTPVLAIDELGKGRKTDWEIAIIDEIVSRAYNHGSLLLGTTNFAPRTGTVRPPTGAVVPGAPGTLARGDSESLQDRLGDRVFSRLREMVTFASVRGDDFRESRSLR